MLNNSKIDKNKFIYILYSLILISFVSLIIYFIFLMLLYKSEKLKEKTPVDRTITKEIETPVIIHEEQKTPQDLSSDAASADFQIKKENAFKIIKENSPLYFIEDTYKLKKSENKKLENAISALADFSEIKLIITGHTDSVGNKGEEFDLSQKRAAFIKEYFIDNAKNIKFDIEIEFFGATKPAYTGDDIDQRYLNRRAEITPIDIK